MFISLVEKMAILAPVGGKIRFHGANEAAGSPDFRTYFTFSLSQKLTTAFDFEILLYKMYCLMRYNILTTFTGLEKIEYHAV